MICFKIWNFTRKKLRDFKDEERRRQQKEENCRKQEEKRCQKTTCLVAKRFLHLLSN